MPAIDRPFLMAYLRLRDLCDQACLCHRHLHLRSADFRLRLDISDHHLVVKRHLRLLQPLPRQRVDLQQHVDISQVCIYMPAIDRSIVILPSTAPSPPPPVRLYSIHHL